MREITRSTYDPKAGGLAPTCQLRARYSAHQDAHRTSQASGSNRHRPETALLCSQTGQASAPSSPYHRYSVREHRREHEHAVQVPAAFVRASGPAPGVTLTWTGWSTASLPYFARPWGKRGQGPGSDTTLDQHPASTRFLDLFHAGAANGNVEPAPESLLI
ncbi:hypothetical protein MKX08_006302 [Trichoderma sp. CBMAI-0020]|nr:hypothetical protein MKX08_006302 [Trichoderma sp. CBMAI-0020]